MSQSNQNSLNSLKLLERKNYVRVSEKLVNAVAEIAEIVSKKMREFNIEVLKVGNFKLYIEREKTQRGVEYTLNFGDGGDLTYNISGNGHEGYYLHGDFNSWIAYSTKDDFLKFALNYKEILTALITEEDRLTKLFEEAQQKIEESK
jgi:hypothetical protein